MLMQMVLLSKGLLRLGPCRADIKLVGFNVYGGGNERPHNLQDEGWSLVSQASASSGVQIQDSRDRWMLLSCQL